MKHLVPREFTVPTLLEAERFRLRPPTIHDVVKDFDAVKTSKGAPRRLPALGLGRPTI